MIGGKLPWVTVAVALLLGYIYYPAPELTQSLQEWQKKGKYFKYKGYDIFYMDVAGIPSVDSTLVCIHGFPTSSFDWSKILEGLKEQFGRVILVDMIGYGFSDKPLYYNYLITTQADIVESLLHSLDITDVHLLSHDYGDTVALELLARYNNDENTSDLALHSLCMLNGGVFPETNFPMAGQKLLAIPYLGALAARFQSFFTFKRSISKVFGATRQPTEEEFWDFYVSIRYKDGHRVISGLIDYIAQRSVNKDRWVGALQKTTIPVHMIYGPADPVNPPVFIHHYRKVVPKPSLDVLDDSVSHYPQWEAPVEVMKSYASFLSSVMNR